MKRHLFVAAAVLASLAGTAFALEFRSVKETGVALYDGPTLSARKLFVVSRYYPVEVLTTQKDWSRVRDATGGIAWIPGAALSNRRTLLVVADRLPVREAADDKSKVLFWAEKDLVLDMADEPQSSWVKVKHRDGTTGYARIGGLWGL
ncbi:SH3 domain-containing protein [Vogesella sp. LIG4]|uniref:SH3 domain-containing protein n=1 Tax=Vogesella sp. LIG4 TaxID=1192162 RepID=UPI0008201906|nr:SH3 domain-containing protein [Vogesella sp. LIG4]SCK07348.1 SH3-like domain-containing protein [Vogesella sp. LIG4]